MALFFLFEPYSMGEQNVSSRTSSGSGRWVSRAHHQAKQGAMCGCGTGSEGRAVLLRLHEMPGLALP